MTPDTIDKAVEEAKRFLKLRGLVRYAQFSDKRRYLPSQPKDTGALRRASMDLTRALAEMRRP
jgi:hypothetical protein